MGIAQAVSLSLGKRKAAGSTLASCFFSEVDNEFELRLQKPHHVCRREAPELCPHCKLHLGKTADVTISTFLFKMHMLPDLLQVKCTRLGGMTFWGIVLGGGPLVLHAFHITVEFVVRFL